ncbi:hypothetical protein Peur_009704 [Populus x canadensis]
MTIHQKASYAKGKVSLTDNPFQPHQTECESQPLFCKSVASMSVRVHSISAKSKVMMLHYQNSNVYLSTIVYMLKSTTHRLKQQPEHLEEETTYSQAPPHHDRDCYMAHSEIPSSKVKGSSKKFEVSFEGVLDEAFQQRSKDLANQPSFGAFEQNSWRLVVNKIGRLVSGWGIKLVVIFNEHNFLLRKRVLYFVYGLRRAVQNSLWLDLSLLIWHFVFHHKVEESKSKILLYGTKILACLFIGTVIWLLKTLLVKALTSSFHVNAFFDRIQEALFNQYVIETLSGPPLFERRSTKRKGQSPRFSR